MLCIIYFLCKLYIYIYTEWKGNKCHPVYSRRGRLKGTKNCLYNMGSKFDSFLRKRCFSFCFVHAVLLISLKIIRKTLYLTRA